MRLTERLRELSARSGTYHRFAYRNSSRRRVYFRIRWECNIANAKASGSPLVCGPRDKTRILAGDADTKGLPAGGVYSPRAGWRAERFRVSRLFAGPLHQPARRI